MSNVEDITLQYLSTTPLDIYNTPHVVATTMEFVERFSHLAGHEKKEFVVLCTSKLFTKHNIAFDEKMVSNMVNMIVDVTKGVFVVQKGMQKPSKPALCSCLFSRSKGKAYKEQASTS